MLHCSNDVKMFDKVSKWVTKFEDHELLQKINNLRASNSSIFYHHSCELLYLNEYKKITTDNARTSWHSIRDIHTNIFNKIVSIIEEVVVVKRKFIISFPL